MTGVPGYALTIISRLEREGYEAYLVGGCVRDLLMGSPPKDIDIATSAKPEQVMATFPKTVPTGLRFGTVTVLLQDGRAEVTTYRVDGEYSDKRRPDAVAFSGSLREDLSRRDFTVNAMAWTPSAGLYDPFSGREDIQNRFIRCVGEPEKRYGEDALRILRGWRFCARLGFALEPKTRLAAASLSHTLSAVSPERVRQELLGILLSPNPDILWRPLSDGCFSHLGLVPPPVEQPPSLQPVPPDLRLAALLRLIAPGEEAAVLTALKLDGDTRRRSLAALSAMELPSVSEEPALRLRMMERGEQATLDGLSLRRALLGEDTASPEAAVSRILSRGDCLRISDLQLGGEDLLSLGVPPGPPMGALLHRLLLHCIDRPEDNDRQILLRLAGELRTEAERGAAL